MMDDVGLCERVELPLSVEVGVAGGVPLLVAVGELEGVPDPLCVGVPVLLSEVEPVLEEEAPSVTEAVGENDMVLLLLSEALAVTVAVPLEEGVAVPVGVEEGVAELVGDAVMETVPVAEAEAPRVMEAVGLWELVELAVSVEEGVCAAVPVPVGVEELEGVTVPV